MKIEMGESLFYSWLRHVKECQVVQTNWKISQHWEINNEDELEAIFNKVASYFEKKYGYVIFKKNSNMNQVIKQGECDVIGMSMYEGKYKTYAIEVAFHEAGLNYGSKEETIMKVIEKCARAALCMYGYLGAKNTEIIFASPKINSAVKTGLDTCIVDLNEVFKEMGYGFRFRIIANEDYENIVLKPILLMSEGVADTSELFLRSYQMFKMFEDKKRVGSTREIKAEKITLGNVEYSDDEFSELKVGQIARMVLSKILEAGVVSESEIELMQTEEYSKKTFDLQYPLLIKAKIGAPKPKRYYKTILKINGEYYRMCQEWFEKEANDDRTPLIKWIKSRRGTEQ